MYRVFLGLGSNLGDRVGFLKRTIHEINSVAPVRSASPVYETQPVDLESAHPFYNMVIEVETGLQPAELIRRLKSIERKLGRKPASHMLDRVIDIDILLYDGFSYADGEVRVPHARLEFRRFVLEPFKDVAPLVVHPTRNQTIASLLRMCHDMNRVVRTDIQIDSTQ